MSWPQLHSISCFIPLDGMSISWQHIISLLEYDLGPARVAFGLRQTKLTSEHVFLAPRSRMNVSLAAQAGFICVLNCIINSLF